MPGVGLNKLNPNESYWLKTWGNPSYKSILDKSILDGWLHYIYETISDPDSYLHYFVDSAVILPSVLSYPWDKEGPYLFDKTNQGFRDFTSKRYTKTSYIGLSGGATTGLSACAVFSFDKCILIAGFVPEYIRVQFIGSWGDAEQTTRSYYEKFPYEDLINIAEKKSRKIIYIYNAYDSCCYFGQAPQIFKNDFPSLDIRITNLHYHGFDSEYLQILLDE
jgi:hypothetical protein